MPGPLIHPNRPGAPGLPPAGRGGGPISAASAGGLNVRVGGNDVTGYLRADSLTMKFNSFDFALRDPAVAPVNGDRVFVLEPAWDGQVVSVRKRYTGAPNLSVTYVVTATNAKDAVASPAPFALSDTPDTAASFKYADLEIATSTTDTGDVTQGTLILWRPGLWPGMTFALTSANFGLSAAEYTVTDLTITWLTFTDIVCALSFGDAMVTLSAWALDQVVYAPDGTISGTKITDGSVTTPKIAANSINATHIDTLDLTAEQLTLRDPAGYTALNSGGFGPTWRRFITSGVYNGDFAAAPVSASDQITASNPLPFWTLTNVSGSAITATSVVDASSASGRVIQLAMAAGAAGDEVYLEQVVPVNAARSRSFAYYFRASFLTGASVSAAVVSLNVAWLKNDATTTTGSGGSSTRTTTSVGIATIVDLSSPSASNSPVPSDAAYARIRLGYKRDVAPIGTTETVSVTECYLQSGSTVALINDGTSPGSFGPLETTQTAGFATITANQGAPSGSSPTLTFDGRFASAPRFLMGASRLAIGGTSFPGTKSAGDMFFRTDLGYWCFWDGTQWLSCHIETTTLAVQEALIGAAANGTFWAPYMGGYSIYALEANVATDVFTTNDGSNYWTVQVGSQDAGSGTARGSSFTTASDTVAQMTTHNVTLNVALAATTDAWYIQFTKTLAPGTIYALAQIRYRIIVT